MRKMPGRLRLLEVLIDALYVIVDCHLRAKIKPSG